MRAAGAHLPRLVASRSSSRLADVRALERPRLRADAEAAPPRGSRSPAQVSEQRRTIIARSGLQMRYKGMLLLLLLPNNAAAWRGVPGAAGGMRVSIQVGPANRSARGPGWPQLWGCQGAVSQILESSRPEVLR